MSKYRFGDYVSIPAVEFARQRREAIAERIWAAIDKDNTQFPFLEEEEEKDEVVAAAMPWETNKDFFVELGKARASELAKERIWNGRELS